MLCGVAGTPGEDMFGWDAATGGETCGPCSRGLRIGALEDKVREHEGWILDDAHIPQVVGDLEHRLDKLVERVNALEARLSVPPEAAA